MPRVIEAVIAAAVAALIAGAVTTRTDADPVLIGGVLGLLAFFVTMAAPRRRF
ncbi:hypothetical protein ABGB07_39860 [Micromonosporaceae bacterium B7E4]